MSFPTPRKRTRLQPPPMSGLRQLTHGATAPIGQGDQSHGPAAGAPVSSPLNFKLSVDYLPLDRLTPAAKRLRRAGKRQQECLQKNIRCFGIVRPILARGDGTVIAGHGILEAAKTVGVEQIPVTYVDHLSDDEIRALRISLHRIEELSSWDNDVLKIELEYLVDVDPDLLVFTGFDTAEVDVRLDDPKAKADAADDVPKIEGPTVSRTGDIWVFKGGHRLICGSTHRLASVGGCRTEPSTALRAADRRPSRTGADHEGWRNDRETQDRSTMPLQAPAFEKAQQNHTSTPPHNAHRGVNPRLQAIALSSFVPP